jgi:hypothetical protein
MKEDVYIVRHPSKWALITEKIEDVRSLRKMMRMNKLTNKDV